MSYANDIDLQQREQQQLIIPATPRLATAVLSTSQAMSLSPTLSPSSLVTMTTEEAGIESTSEMAAFSPGSYSMLKSILSNSLLLVVRDLDNPTDTSTQNENLGEATDGIEPSVTQANRSDIPMAEKTLLSMMGIGTDHSAMDSIHGDVAAIPVVPPLSSSSSLLLTLKDPSHESEDEKAAKAFFASFKNKPALNLSLPSAISSAIPETNPIGNNKNNGIDATVAHGKEAAILNFSSSDADTLPTPCSVQDNSDASGCSTPDDVGEEAAGSAVSSTSYFSPPLSAPLPQSSLASPLPMWMSSIVDADDVGDTIGENGTTGVRGMSDILGGGRVQGEVMGCIQGVSGRGGRKDEKVEGKEEIQEMTTEGLEPLFGEQVEAIWDEADFLSTAGWTDGVQDFSPGIVMPKKVTAQVNYDAVDFGPDFIARFVADMMAAPPQRQPLQDEVQGLAFFDDEQISIMQAVVDSELIVKDEPEPEKQMDIPSNIANKTTPFAMVPTKKQFVQPVSNNKITVANPGDMNLASSLGAHATFNGPPVPAHNTGAIYAKQENLEGFPTLPTLYPVTPSSHPRPQAPPQSHSQVKPHVEVPPHLAAKLQTKPLQPLQDQAFRPSKEVCPLEKVALFQQRQKEFEEQHKLQVYQHRMLEMQQQRVKETTEIRPDSLEFQPITQVLVQSQALSHSQALAHALNQVQKSIPKSWMSSPLLPASTSAGGSLHTSQQQGAASPAQSRAQALVRQHQQQLLQQPMLAPVKEHGFQQSLDFKVKQLEMKHQREREKMMGQHQAANGKISSSSSSGFGSSSRGKASSSSSGKRNNSSGSATTDSGPPGASSSGGGGNNHGGGHDGDGNGDDKYFRDHHPNESQEDDDNENNEDDDDDHDEKEKVKSKTKRLGANASGKQKAKEIIPVPSDDGDDEEEDTSSDDSGEDKDEYFQLLLSMKRAAAAQASSAPQDPKKRKTGQTEKRSRATSGTSSKALPGGSVSRRAIPSRPSPGQGGSNASAGVEGYTIINSGHVPFSGRLGQYQEEREATILCEFEGCTRMFTSIGLLKSHMVSHDPDRRYQCPDCPTKRYKRNHDLLRHRREKHLEHPTTRQRGGGVAHHSQSARALSSSSQTDGAAAGTGGSKGRGRRTFAPTSVKSVESATAVASTGVHAVIANAGGPSGSTVASIQYPHPFQHPNLLHPTNAGNSTVLYERWANNLGRLVPVSPPSSNSPSSAFGSFPFSSAVTPSTENPLVQDSSSGLGSAAAAGSYLPHNKPIPVHLQNEYMTMLHQQHMQLRALREQHVQQQTHRENELQMAFAQNLAAKSDSSLFMGLGVSSAGQQPVSDAGNEATTTATVTTTGDPQVGILSSQPSAPSFQDQWAALLSQTSFATSNGLALPGIAAATGGPHASAQLSQHSFMSQEAILLEQQSQQLEARRSALRQAEEDLERRAQALNEQILATATALTNTSTLGLSTFLVPEGEDADDVGAIEAVPEQAVEPSTADTTDVEGGGGGGGGEGGEGGQGDTTAQTTASTSRQESVEPQSDASTSPSLQSRLKHRLDADETKDAVESKDNKKNKSTKKEKAVKVKEEESSLSSSSFLDTASYPDTAATDATPTTTAPAEGPALGFSRRRSRLVYIRDEPVVTRRASTRKASDTTSAPVSPTTLVVPTAATEPARKVQRKLDIVSEDKKEGEGESQGEDQGQADKNVSRKKQSRRRQ